MKAQKLTLTEWNSRYAELRAAGLSEPDYGGPLERHVEREGDLRLRNLRFDNSPAALRLWNFVLTENERLAQARARGERIVGVMKDLGTVPVLAYSLPKVRAFYPDGTWWTPCLMECSDGLLDQAEQLGIDASFCPVRGMLPAFLNEEHFPRPDLLICSTGAVCDDFSAIAQRLERLGFPILWWEMPRRRSPGPGEPGILLPGGLRAPGSQVELLRVELQRIAAELGKTAGVELSERALARGIHHANEVRRRVRALRKAVYTAPGAALPALEMLLVEVLAIHFCSDAHEVVLVLDDLLAEVNARLESNRFVIEADAVRIFWVNPVADLRAMNLVEEWGGRICGADFMFDHAIESIPEDVAPFDALARSALADPMAGSSEERAGRIVAECRAAGAEALVVSRIPGASHCAREGAILRERTGQALGLPTVEIEIPHLCDAMLPNIGGRFQAVIETARERRAR